MRKTHSETLVCQSKCVFQVHAKPENWILKSVTLFLWKKASGFCSATNIKWVVIFKDAYWSGGCSPPGVILSYCWEELAEARLSNEGELTPRGSHARFWRFWLAFAVKSLSWCVVAVSCPKWGLPCKTTAVGFPRWSPSLNGLHSKCKSLIPR